jgi:septal ring factor EnvC (AmiA/AmiB activator)
MKYSIFFSLPIILTPFSAGAVPREYPPTIGVSRTASNHHRQIVAARPQEILRSIDENRLQTQQLTQKIAAHQALIKVTNSQIQAAQERFSAESDAIERQINQTQARIAATQKALRSNQQILEDIRPAAEQGALSRVQVVRQEQEVSSRANELAQHKQELTRLISEKENLKVAHRNAETQSQQTINQQTVQILKHLIEIEQLNTDHQRLHRILKNR